jgi:hypothetical protein
MERIEQVYFPVKWYDKYAKVQISNLLMISWVALGDPKLSNEDWETDLKIMKASCDALQQPLEKAYSLLQVSKSVYKRNDKGKNQEKAQELLAEALKELKKRDECQAVVEWVLGSVEWWFRQGISGAQHWAHAKETLDILMSEAVKNHEDTKASFFKECRNQLEKQELEMTGSVQSGTLLFNLHQKSRLSQVTLGLVQMMKKMAAEKKIAEAKKVSDLLRKNTRFSEESAEALVECGATAYELNDPAQAVKDWEEARVKYRGETENLLAVNWMLAAAKNKPGIDPAARKQNWKDCEENLTKLSADVNRMKDAQSQEKKKWFEILSGLVKKLSA